MADLYEVLITAELTADLPEADVTELRWHLGIGGKPEALSIVTSGGDVVTMNEDGEPLPRDQWWAEFSPLLDQRGPADGRIGGVAFAELVRREGTGDDAWALTSRQVRHADELDGLSELLSWLRQHAVGHRGGPPIFSCHMRFYEDGPVLRPVTLQDGELVIQEAAVRGR
jgi:hypothetical protein